MCAIEKDTLTVQIRDWGVALKMSKSNGANVQSICTRNGAFWNGFCFMEAFMDDLKVSSSVGNGTLVQMKKKSAAAREQNRGVFSGVFVKAV